MKLINTVAMEASFELLSRRHSNKKSLRVRTAGLLFALIKGIQRLESCENPSQEETELLKIAKGLEKKITQKTV